MMLIALPTPCRMAPCSPPISTAPAPRNSSWMKLRPFSGSSVTCRAVMVWPMLALPVSSVTAAAFTSTVSATLPASRSRSTRWIWIDGELDVGAHRDLEPGLLGRHHVAADRQQRHHVVALLVGRRAAGQAGVLVGHGDLHLGDHRAGRVLHRAGDLSGRRLARCRRRGAQDEHHRAEHGPVPANARRRSPHRAAQPYRESHQGRHRPLRTHAMDTELRHRASRARACVARWASGRRSRMYWRLEGPRPRTNGVSGRSLRAPVRGRAVFVASRTTAR